MTNSQLHKVRTTAIELYLASHNNAYDSELQTILCTIKAFVQVAKAELGQDIKFEEVVRQVYQPVDSE